MSFVAQMLVRMAAALAPRSTRARHLEEWRADLAGAHEVGISPLSVALGAWRSIPSIASFKGASMQPIGPLAIILRRTNATRRPTLAIAVALTMALLAGLAVLAL